MIIKRLINLGVYKEELLTYIKTYGVFLWNENDSM